MKLHFSFAVDALRENYPLMKQILGPASNWKLKVGYPHILQSGDDGAHFGRGDLVLSDAGNLPESAKGFEGCSLVCIGEAPDSYKDGTCDYVELPSDAALSEVLECLIAVNERLESWRDKVVAAMVHMSSFTELYELYFELFENPVYFTDSVHNIVVYVEDASQLDEPDIYHFLSHDLADAEIREKLMYGVLTSPRYEATFKTEGPQLWSDDVAPFDSLYCNVVSDGTFRGRILVDERARHFRISDYALTQMLHDDMETLASSRLWLERDLKVDVWQHLLDVLDGANPNAEMLDSVMRNAGWEKGTRFICLVARLNERDMTIGSGDVNGRLIEKAIPGSRALFFDNSIVVIAPVGTDETHRELFSQELALVIRDNLMKVGASNEFTNLSELRLRYDQAQLALEAGRKLGKTDWVLHCDDAFLFYMLDHCNGSLTHQALCHSKLQKLIEYDSEHDLEYTKTLQSYLENSCSQAETCRALFLHRSTLIQRLKRITDITKLDLDDKDTRLYLLMYFASIEQRKATVL